MTKQAPTNCSVERRVGKPRRARLGWFCAHALGVSFVFLTFVIVAAGALMFRLGQGPLSISGLTARIAGELADRLGPGYQVTLGASSVERVGASIRLALAGLTVTDDGGRRVFIAPRARVSIALAPLISGSIKPTQVDIEGVDLRLTIQEDGAVALSAGAEPIVLAPGGPRAQPDQAVSAPPTRSNAAAGALTPVARAVADILSIVSDGSSPLARMQGVAITGGRLSFEDRRASKSITFSNVDLGFNRRDAVANLLLSADGPNGRWDARATAASAAARAFEVEVRDLSFDEIALAIGLNSPDAFFDTPLSAKISVSLDATGDIASAQARFNVGAGFFFNRDPDFEPIYIEQFTGGLSWDGGAQRLTLEPTQFVAGETHIVASGFADAPSAPDGAWRVEGATQPGSSLGPERPGQTPVSLDSSSLALNIFPAQQKLLLDHLSVDGPDAQFTLSGEFDWSEAKRGLRARLTNGRTTLRSALRIWPDFIAPPVHGWLRKHATAGFLEPSELAIDFDGAALDKAFQKLPPDDERLHLEFAVSGATLSFLPGVPPLTSLDLTGVVTGHTATAAAKRGFLDGATGHRLTFSDGTFKVADTTVQPGPAQVSARVTGTIDSLVDILSREGLRPMVGPLGDTSGVKGQVDGRLIVDLLLDKKPRPEGTQVRANATISDMSIDKIIGKERFEQGQLTLALDKAGMHASGAGKLLGGASQIDFHKPPVGPMEANIAFTIDDAARARLAPVFATGVSGPIMAKVSSIIAGKDPAPAHVELDFSRSAIDNPVPGLVKAAGRPAKATFRLQNGADGARLDQLQFDSSTGAAMRGAIDLDNAGSLKSARFSLLRLSPGDDLKVDVDQGKDAIKIVARGAAIDARPFIRTVVGVGGASTDDKSRDSLGRDIDVDLKANLATGNNRQTLSNVDMKLVRRGGAVHQFNLQATQGRAQVSASTAPGLEGKPTISIATTDGGALLSFVDLYRRMEGGRLRVEVQPGSRGVSGALFVRDLVLRDEPALRRLVSEGAPKDDGTQARKIDTTAAPFQRLSGIFSRANGVLTIRDGVLYGAQIGIKIDGSLDYARDRVDLTGTFVPAYGLNNLFTQIPLVGPILSGGNHEGLFAVNFRVSGPATSPSLVINPLSAIAPGFLRKIFGVGAAQTPDVASPAPDDVSSSIPRP